ncbi:MAG TPA: flagellar export chaperone FliS [Candidatus Hydrogenedentes bacterium]|nr:flagellar export chaperone FliS [Candidatus Hydrogenedentota bacterium]
MSASAVRVGAYTQVNIETASQGKLIVMLFNGAIKRAEEAKRQMEKGGTENVHNNLIRAQDIVAELRGALNMNMGEIATNLDRIYEYFQHLLVVANIKKSTQPIEECIVLMTQVRDMWKELFDTLAREGQDGPASAVNPHGAAILNMQG